MVTFIFQLDQIKPAVDEVWAGIKTVLRTYDEDLKNNVTIPTTLPPPTTTTEATTTTTTTTTTIPINTTETETTTKTTTESEETE